ncbi:UNVERIFIED_CONTAM: hypothetical protein Sangu_2905200 [Sesamum angustifolium]|uniref:Reverse transcriptase domain-containing protein n=1 Tax=Sesamum angustifolium TaxID=2727405 RepID=A0AAW2ILH4_9LAMI
MSRSFKATTIVLIPKVDSPQTWNDFRPIFLCNVSNKILSKLLYKKIPHALPDIISPNQSGFVPGRLISGNILMAQEMIHHLDLRYKNNNMMIKLDMSKAYDRVNWNFLITVMQKMGFPPRFLTLIKHAVQNCWFSILVNGEAIGFLQIYAGIKTRRPISPALFIIAAEAFSNGLNPLFNENPDMYYQTKCEVKLSHLSYADDIILFTNCKEAGSPITYLGEPLYKSNKRKILYENLIDKVRSKTSGWEHFHLSYGGRLQLIKTVLLSMPIYLLQVLNPLTQASGKDFVQFEKKHKENIFWSLGTGTTSFWHDWWLPEGTLANLVGTQCNLHFPVSWFWSKHEWDVQKLQQAVPTYMIELITEILINIDQSDILHWKLSKNGALTIKSTWNEIRSHQQPQHLYRSLCV